MTFGDLILFIQDAGNSRLRLVVGRERGEHTAAQSAVSSRQPAQGSQPASSAECFNTEVAARGPGADLSCSGLSRTTEKNQKAQQTGGLYHLRFFPSSLGSAGHPWVLPKSRALLFGYPSLTAPLQEQCLSSRGPVKLTLSCKRHLGA